MNKIWTVLLVCNFGSAPCFSQTESTSSVPEFQSKIEYLFDPTMEIDSTNVYGAEFEELDITNSNWGTQQGNYWFKITLQSKSDSAEELIFDIPHRQLNKAILYKKKGGEITRIAVAGNQFLMDERPIEHRYTAFSVSTETNELAVYFININFHRVAQFPLTIYTEREFHAHTQNDMAMTGLYFGIVIMVIMMNLFYYFSFRDNIFLHYCLFLASITTAFFLFDGLLIYVLQPVPKFENIDLIVHFSVGATGAIFATNYLEIERSFPRIKWIGMVWLGVLLIMYALYQITEIFWFFAAGDAVGFGLLFLYWVTGFFLIKKSRFAIFFVAAYSLVLISGILYLIPFNFGISHIGITLDTLKIGSIFEMLIFTYGITYRMKILQQENVLIRKELVSYLEKINELSNEQLTESKNLYSLLLHNDLGNEPLSLRELEVLECIGGGLSNSQIGEKLFISLNTVKFHIRNIYDKLEITNRKEAKDKVISLVK